MMEIIERLNTALESRYEILKELGEGGMATVYLARDVRHERKVAVKVLRPELAAVVGGERFLAEIKTTAALQHPHILPLFDSGETDGFLFYVMPHVEDESLQDRLARERQLPVDEAVRIAAAIAGALDYAHRHHVIHRDVKPANILLHEGEPLVADFGIALAVSQAGGGRITETGLSLGTPHYMSPEQASGERGLDLRTDVYALGCVLFEMLAGQPPYSGPTAQSVLARILTEQAPNITALRGTVPPHVAAVVARSLEKLPADRFESAGAFQKALEDPAFTYQPARSTSAIGLGATRQAVASGSAPRETSWIRDWRSVAALGALAVAAGGWAVSLLAGDRLVPGGGDAVVTRFQLSTGELAVPEDIALSPDGSLLVFSSQPLDGGSRRLYLRPSDGVGIEAIPDTENGREPAFSPDGQWIAFVTGENDEELRRIPVAGGRSTLITELEPWLADPHWGPDGTLVFSGYAGLHRVSFEGGPPEQILTGEVVASRYPHLLPGGDRVLFTHFPFAADEGEIRLLDLESGEVSTVLKNGQDAVYLESGHILFGNSEQALFAAPFDLERGVVTGPTAPVLDEVTVGTQGGPVHFALSPSGTAAFAAGSPPEIEETLVTVHLDGREEPFPLAPGDYSTPRFSPDGRRMAYEWDGGIWVFDLVTGGKDRISAEGGAFNPIWNPDGTVITFGTVTAARDLGMMSRPIDLSEGPRLLYASEDLNLPWSWTPDGSRLVFAQSERGSSGFDIWILPADPDGELRPYLRASWNEMAPDVSPDGHWVAYESNEDGRTEVFIRSFPEPEARYRVSQTGGLGARWSADGRRLFYRNDDTVMVADIVADSSELRVTSRRVLFVGRYRGIEPHPDGDRIVAIKLPEAQSRREELEASRRFYMVVNWTTEMGRRLRTN